MNNKLIMVSPRSCIPPHKISHPDKLIDLTNKFIKDGWGNNQEALIGYSWKDKIQLLSGTHRWYAARLAKIKTIPVLVWKRKVVESAFGDLLKWQEIMTSVRVNET